MSYLVKCQFATLMATLREKLVTLYLGVRTVVIRAIHNGE